MMCICIVPRSDWDIDFFRYSEDKLLIPNNHTKRIIVDYCLHQSMRRYYGKSNVGSCLCLQLLDVPLIVLSTILGGPKFYCPFDYVDFYYLSGEKEINTNGEIVSIPTLSCTMEKLNLCQSTRVVIFFILSDWRKLYNINRGR